LEFLKKLSVNNDLKFSEPTGFCEISQAVKFSEKSVVRQYDTPDYVK